MTVLSNLVHDLPHNFEAEPVLLGSILMANTAHQRVAEFLRPEHFADPLHGRRSTSPRTATADGHRQVRRGDVQSLARRAGQSQIRASRLARASSASKKSAAAW